MMYAMMRYAKKSTTTIRRTLRSLDRNRRIVYAITWAQGRAMSMRLRNQARRARVCITQQSVVQLWMLEKGANSDNRQRNSLERFARSQQGRTLHTVEKNQKTMQQSECSQLSLLRRPWYKNLSRMGKRRRSVHFLYRDTSRPSTGRQVAGPNKQQWQLRARQFTLGHTSRTKCQQAGYKRISRSLTYDGC